MKIRADFVTNSSSSSYVDIYADNPVLNELLEKYNDTTDYMYEHFTTDWCDEHENLEYSSSLLEFLNLVGGNNGKQKELEEKRALLLSSFRYAKYNTGFHYTDGYLSGEEHHITLSSRWGVVDQHTWIDEEKINEENEDEDYDDENEDEYEDEYDEDDEYDDELDSEGDDEDDEDDDDQDDENEYDNLVPNQHSYEEYWENVETDIKEKPTEATAGFVGVRPEDLEKRTDLSDKLRLIVDNLSKEPVKIKNKKFVFIGDYDHYYSLTANDGSEDDEEDNWDEWDDDNTDPWDDREYTHVIKGNIPEIMKLTLRKL